MKENIRKTLLKMAGWKLSQKLIIWAFIHVPSALPIHFQLVAGKPDSEKI